MSISPLAPAHFPTLPVLAGVSLAVCGCGIRYKDRPDLLLALLDPGTAVAGVLTRSKTASAPVDWCRKMLPAGRAHALVVNSGNSNAFTGKQGAESVSRTAHAAAAVIGGKPQEVFIASTGVIGVPLQDEKITAALPALYKDLREDSWEMAARAIMTTDTFPKAVTRRATIGKKTVTINGIAKGSGMIAPDMATMLAFLFTDAAIPQPVLQSLLSDANRYSFNAITVDSDTSTSDTALLFATGKAGNAEYHDPKAPELADFRAQLHAAMLELAHMIVKDGEGATKFISVTVTGAATEAAARTIGLSIANSPLVKTAIAGEDPNWGRIVAAVGKSGEMADRDKLGIRIGDVLVAEKGRVHPAYVEGPTANYMKGRDIRLSVDVGVGRAEFTVWTCDLTEQYIKINADYRS